MRRNGHIVALGIAKNEGAEQKICTVRVAPCYQNRGIGIKMFDGLLEWLNVEYPLLSVSESKYHEFARIFDYYGFSLTSIRKDYYIRGQNEYFFNETL